MILHPKHKRMASLICFGAAKDHLLLCMQSTRPPPERIKDHLLLCADSCVADSCVGEYFESFMVEMLHSRVEMLHSREWQWRCYIRENPFKLEFHVWGGVSYHYFFSFLRDFILNIFKVFSNTRVCNTRVCT